MSDAKKANAGEILIAAAGKRVGEKTTVIVKGRKLVIVDAGWLDRLEASTRLMPGHEDEKMKEFFAGLREGLKK